MSRLAIVSERAGSQYADRAGPAAEAAASMYGIATRPKEGKASVPLSRLPLWATDSAAQDMPRAAVEPTQLAGATEAGVDRSTSGNPSPPPQDEGRPLDAPLRDAFAHRFAYDLAAVRVHHDAAAGDAARERGARALTDGVHVSFAPGQYEPATSKGRALIAHELAHVGQYLAGDHGGERDQEIGAHAVEAGASFGASTSAGRVGRTAGPLRPGPHSLGPQHPGPQHPGPQHPGPGSLRLRPGDATSVTITTTDGRHAQFSAEVEGGGTLHASGTVTGLEPGEYLMHMNGTQVVMRHRDGTPLLATTRWDIPLNPANRALIGAVGATTTDIDLHVVSGPATPAVDPHSGGVDPDTDEGKRQQLEQLPTRIRNFLFSSDGPPTNPADYDTLLRIAHILDTLTEDEIEEYRARTTSLTADPSSLERSVTTWQTQVQQRRNAQREQDTATQQLYGMGDVYGLYQSWLSGLQMGGPPAWIADWEALPVSALPVDRDGFMNQLYLRLRRALAQHGLANLAAFAAAITRFVSAFRDNAALVGFEMLDRYEHLLVSERARYAREGFSRLVQSIAPAHAELQQAEAYKQGAMQQYGNGWDPSDVLAYHAAGVEYQRQVAVATGHIAAQGRTDPLLANRDFPRESLGHADEAGAARIMNDYIASGLDHVHSTRDRIRNDHETIFRLPVLVEETESRQGIPSNSVWTRIIADHTAPTIDEQALEIMTAVFALVLGAIATAATGGLAAAAAVGTVGVSAVSAYQQYQDYAFRADAYGAQMLREEPSLVWVVVALVGLGLDLAAVSPIIRGIRPVLQEFERTADLVTLESKLGGVEERIRRAILRRAELEARAIRGWQSILPPGVRVSVFGLEIAADLLGKAAYSIQLNLRRGINTFNRWVLTREAVALIGDIGSLTPAQLARVRTIYTTGVENAQLFATRGRALGMNSEEIDGAIEAWARRGTGTVEEAVAEMSAGRTPRAPGDPVPAEHPGWTPPKGWNGPVNHGRWTGIRGSSGWIDDRPEVIRIVGRSATGEANAVPFRDGVVDFSTWSQGEIDVPGLVGEHAEDMVNIRIAVADRQNLLPAGSRSARAQAALDWLRDAPDGFGGTGLRPHHAGGNRIELIPRDVHKIQHTDLAIYPTAD